MSFFAVVIAAWAFVFFLLLPNPHVAEKFLSRPFFGYAHVFGGAVALLCGPFQLSTRFRTRHLRLHRGLGMIYLTAVLFGGVAALYWSIFSDGGLVGHLGFGILAILWLYTSGRALYYIKQRNIVAHRDWMIRSFALTYAAVMLRIYLSLSGVFGIPFEVAYPVIAWLCWVPNVIFAEIFLSRATLPTA